MTIKKLKPRLRIIRVFLVLPLVLSSCFGIKSSVTVNKDFSGNAVLEYRVSNAFLALGALDGNTPMPTLPVGEEDIRRSAARIEGLTLQSLSSKDDGTDTTYKINFAFKHINSFVDFLDLKGEQADFVTKDGKNLLTLRLGGGSEETADAELETLARTLFEGYEFELTLTTPTPPVLKVTDETGVSIGGATNQKTKNSVYYAAPISTLVLGKSKTVEISW
jgi:hypothetical protein